MLARRRTPQDSLVLALQWIDLGPETEAHGNLVEKLLNPNLEFTAPFIDERQFEILLTVLVRIETGIQFELLLRGVTTLTAKQPT